MNSSLILIRYFFDALKIQRMTDFIKINWFYLSFLITIIISFFKNNLLFCIFSILSYFIIYFLKDKIFYYRENFIIIRIKNYLENNPNTLFSQYFFVLSFMYLLVRRSLLWLTETAVKNTIFNILYIYGLLFIQLYVLNNNYPYFMLLVSLLLLKFRS